MIRLPATAISLSENDIQFHMQQVEIYHGLLKQGFNKQDIARYLGDYRKATLMSDQSLVQLGIGPAPSTVEIASRQIQQQPALLDETSTKGEVRVPRPSPTHPRQESPKEEFEASAVSQAEPHNQSPSHIQDPTRGGEQSVQEDDDNSEDLESISPVVPPPSMRVNKHAPRQSSLLRHAQTLSPEPHSDRSEELESLPLPLSPRALRYRARSLTYPYVSSEIEYSSITDSDQLVEQFRDISFAERTSSGHSSCPSDGIPLPLPPAFPSTSRSTAVRVTTPIYSPAGRSRSQSSGFLGSFESASDMPSSPPLPPSTPLPANTVPSDLLTTPTPNQAVIPISQTEPQNEMPRYLDGSAFSVYNDSMPSGSQPRTPADLSRGAYITEREAVYTAPPGMGRFWSLSSATRGLPDLERNVGEQSPTIRAIGMRERRNHEMWRSVRAEGARMRRMRLRDQAMFSGVADESGQTQGRHQLDDAWRDELDADRVGEENFETDLTITEDGIMRVVSGNARFDT